MARGRLDAAIKNKEHYVQQVTKKWLDAMEPSCKQLEIGKQMIKAEAPHMTDEDLA